MLFKGADFLLFVGNCDTLFFAHVSGKKSVFSSCDEGTGGR
jgi:hypothetical protein